MVVGGEAAGGCVLVRMAAVCQSVHRSSQNEHLRRSLTVLMAFFTCGRGNLLRVEVL